MDPITHTLLGASSCQAFYSRKLGRKCIVLGALSATLPDIDIVPGMIYGSFVGLVVHRGPTHSLWFPFLVGPLLGYLVSRWYISRNPFEPLLLKHWMAMFSVVLLSHPLLDVFTSYGTQLWAPFSNHRYAINAIGVIDPFYTGILFVSTMIGLWACWRRSPNLKLARVVACFALALSTGYILYGRTLNQKAQDIASNQLVSSPEMGEKVWQVIAYPTLLQLYGRRIVARSNDHVCIGFLSLWKRHGITWNCKNEILNREVDMVRKTREGQIFEWFAMGVTFATMTAEKEGKLIKIYDLRYGFDEPDQGLWYIQAKFSPQNQLLSAVTYETQEVSRELALSYLKLNLSRTF